MRKKQHVIRTTITLLGLLMVSLVYSQTVTRVSGTLTNGKGEPLAGATVTNTSTKKAVSSGNDGSFNIDAVRGNKLEISSVGYKSAIIAITGNAPIILSLETAAGSLNEVVVVGFGTQRKVNVTSSISTVNKESLANRPLTNASQALQGASGVYVNQSSGGQPGADDATIRIRGVGTLNNNDPLILVDGIAYNLHDINPNDIESVSVLKDAAAASIYGNRAANGVILIKTKSGSKGKMTINYDNSFGWQQTTYLPDLITNSADEAKLFNQALVNQGVVLSPGVNSFSQAQIDSFAANYGKQSNLYPSTNWFDVTLHKAFMQQHNLRFSGGSDKAVYSVSLGYLNQDGVLIGANAKKYSLSSNLAVDISSRFKIGLNLNMVYWLQNQSPTGSAGMFNTIYRMRPEFNPTLANGNFADNYLPTGLLNGQNSFRNPYVMATSGMNQTNSSDILANVYAEYTLPLNIKYKANFGATKGDLYQKIFTPNTLLYNPVTGAANPLDWGGIASSQPKSAERLNTNNINTTFYHTLTWSGKVADKHNIDLLVGNSFEDYLTLPRMLMWKVL